MIKCSKCNSVPNENDVIGWKCNSCGKTFKVSKAKLHSIVLKKAENPEKSYINCPSCKKCLDDGNERIVWKCACGNMNMAKLRDFEEMIESASKSKLIKCPECGNEVADNVNVCPSCGFEIIQSEAETEKIMIKANINDAVPVSKNKKYIGFALCVAAGIMLIVAFTKINNDTYSFYKQHYKECMEGYAESNADANNSGGLFRGTYRYIASGYEDMAKDDNKKIWNYRIQAIILCLGGGACGIVGYKFIKGENSEWH